MPIPSLTNGAAPPNGELAETLVRLLQSLSTRGAPLEPPRQQQEYVTLDQAAAMVRRSKRSLERYRRKLPPPQIRGGGGRPHLWSWENLKPWLEREFGFVLPERFPGQ